MGEEDLRPLKHRTGNTMRREPQRVLRKGARLCGEVMRISGASVETREALNLPLEDTVPYSLKKKRRWQVFEELTDPLDACAVRMEEVSEMARLRRGPDGHHRISIKAVRRSERIVTPGGHESCEELHLCISRPLAAAELSRKRSCCRRVQRQKNSPKRAALRSLEMQFDSDSELQSSDSERYSNDEEPPRHFPSLKDFMNDRTAPSRKQKRKEKTRRCSFHLLRVPSVPDRRSESRDAVPEPQPEEKEYVMRLEDPVRMLGTFVTVPSAQILPLALRCAFGERHWESASHPRRFAIDISARFRSAAGLPGPRCPAAPLAFLVLEVVRETQEESELELFLNALLIKGDTLALAPIRTPQTNFEALVEICTKAAAACFGDGVEEARPDSQLLLLSAQGGHEPLTSGPRSVRSQEAPLQTSLWSRRAPSDGASSDAVTDECGICFETMEDGQGCRLRCGHLFCELCWRSHLVASVRQGRLELRCAAFACEEPTDLATALRFVSLSVLEQHRRLTVAAAMEEGGLTVFCPSRQCRRAVRLTGATGSPKEVDRAVRCLCGHVFCFACAAEGHWPASCEAYEEYRTKAKQLGRWQDREEHQAMRVKVHGQRCPKCRRFFEKSCGCDCMDCYCGAHFCYLCGKERAEHGRDFPCRLTFARRRMHLLKTRHTDVQRQHALNATVSCPTAFKRALEVRDMRLALGNSFKFRRRFGSTLVRFCNVRSVYCLQKSPTEQWMTVYHSVMDILRTAEFCHVARHAADDGNRHRHLEDQSSLLRSIAAEILRLLDDQTSKETFVQMLLTEAKGEIRRMHFPVNRMRSR